MMGQGAAFHVGPRSDRLKSPLDYRTNMQFNFSNGQSIFVIDCHSFQNQVGIKWLFPEDSTFGSHRGPDLLDYEDFETHVQDQVRAHPKYFEVSWPFATKGQP